MARITMTKEQALLDTNLSVARTSWPSLSQAALVSLAEIVARHHLSIEAGDLIYLSGHWYVTHSGLLAMARRNRCHAIHTRIIGRFCEPAAQRWTFQAVVYRSRTCRGFVGYGDADPSNVSPLVRGAEMRVAETRAVNRALRKAYGIGLCSVEEMGSSSGSFSPAREPKPA